MQTVTAARASAILYNLLVSRADTRPWLLPANICPIVPITFLKANTPFQLVDIGDDLHMDREQAAHFIQTRKFSGMLYAHTYGEESTPQEFFTALKEHAPEFFIIDDRCLCLPALEPSDTAADVVLFSTGYAKIVEFNAGGYAFLRDDLAYHAESLTFHPEDHEEIERLYKQTVQRRQKFVYHDSDWLQIDPPFPTWYDYSQRIAAQKQVSLARRARLNRIYQARLPQEIQLPPSYQTWRFNLRVKNPSQILSAIFKAGLFASSHYASLAGIMTDDAAPRAETLAHEALNLFNDEHFDEEKAQRTCDIILENYQQP